MALELVAVVEDGLGDLDAAFLNDEEAVAWAAREVGHPFSSRFPTRFFDERSSLGATSKRAMLFSREGVAFS